MDFFSVSGPYISQYGIALTAGGGTLVLGSHDNVSMRLRLKFSSEFTLYIYIY